MRQAILIASLSCKSLMTPLLTQILAFELLLHATLRYKTGQEDYHSRWFESHHRCGSERGGSAIGGVDAVVATFVARSAYAQRSRPQVRTHLQQYPIIGIMVVREVKLEVDPQGVAVLTLNHPPVNALHPQGKLCVACVVDFAAVGAYAH